MRQFRVHDSFLQNFPSLAQKIDDKVHKTKSFRLENLLKLLLPLQSGATIRHVPLIKESMIFYKPSFVQYLEFCIRHKFITDEHNKYTITEKGKQFFNMFAEQEVKI